MKYCITGLLTLFVFHLGISQNNMVQGKLQAADGSTLSYANVVLYQSIDSSIAKVEVSDDSGQFIFENLPNGAYYIETTYIGYEELVIGRIDLFDNEVKDLGVLEMRAQSLELETAIVSAQRSHSGNQTRSDYIQRTRHNQQCR